MIDRLREQIQQRLDQLASEAERLREALIALDPRSSAQPARTQAAPARKPAGRRRAPARARSTPKAAASAEAAAPARAAAAPAAKPARRAGRPTGSNQAKPGATKATVLEALAGGEALTAGQVAAKTGLGRGTVSTTLSRLAKSGEVERAARGYKRAG